MFVELMSSQVFSTFESCSAILFRANERSIFADFVGLDDVKLKLCVGFEAKFTELADEIATVSLNVDRVVADSIKH